MILAELQKPAPSDESDKDKATNIYTKYAELSGKNFTDQIVVQEEKFESSEYETAEATGQLA